MQDLRTVYKRKTEQPEPNKYGIANKVLISLAEALVF